jgi:hypothetical protein
MARALKSGLLSDHYRPGVRLGYKRPVAFDPTRTLGALVLVHNSRISKRAINTCLIRNICYLANVWIAVHVL